MTNGPSGTPHNARSRASDPAPSQVPATTIRAASPPHVSPAQAAPPARTFFDPWNSSSTGHQRAENRLSRSTSWRLSRSRKLGEQYKGGLGGGAKRVADTVGAGSVDFGKHGRTENGSWEKGAKGLRAGGQKSLAELWGASKVVNKSSHKTGVERADLVEAGAEPRYAREDSGQSQEPAPALHEDPVHIVDRLPDKLIFAGLCFYINGSTAPLVSDHKLKHMLAAHGATHSIALGRRSVTHVLLGTANVHGGAGGGLAATKIHKEISKSGGQTVKFITAEWVIESIKANRRLPESRFSPLKLAPKSQNSVFDILRAGGRSTTKQGHS